VKGQEDAGLLVDGPSSVPTNGRLPKAADADLAKRASTGKLSAAAQEVLTTGAPGSGTEAGPPRTANLRAALPTPCVEFYLFILHQEEFFCAPKRFFVCVVDWTFDMYGC